MEGRGEEERALEAEARVLGRYLVGQEPPPDLVARYRQANLVLFAEPAAPVDAALVGFVRRHPWSVSFLDAAAALLRPGQLLRNKVLVMAAILEASPTFADAFFPRTVGRAGLVLRVLGLGMLAAARTAAGMLVYAAAVRARA